MFEDTFLDAQASLLLDKQPESSVKETHLRYFWQKMNFNPDICPPCEFEVLGYESIATVGESRVWWRADFQSGSRVLKKVF